VSRLERIASRIVGCPVLLLPILLLAACGQPVSYGSFEYGTSPSGERSTFAPSHYYPPPGPPEDPWGPYIREAATRYAVPEQWVRAVMQQESGGEEQAVSPVGAMGLMQVMPETYEGLRQRYGLGEDPFDPHNNIPAGTAYIREMYDRFGAPGFLAAYNAGPDRVDSYLAGVANLPEETVNYVASVTPNLGYTGPMSGPLARYASARGRGTDRITSSVTKLAAGCDLNAAYDPNHPCTTLVQAASTPTPVQQSFVGQTGAGGCDLNAAYDPNNPCTSVSQVPAATAPPQPIRQAIVDAARPTGCDVNAASEPDHPCTSAGPASPPIQLASLENCDPDGTPSPGGPCRTSSPGRGTSSPYATEGLNFSNTSDAYYRSAISHPTQSPAVVGGVHMLAIPNRDWAIQVGAFANPALARSVAEGARAQAPDQLRKAVLALPPIAAGGSTLYRARLAHLSASAASNACWRLNQRQLPCIVVQPRRS
jgi:D-alanyl-D-alanine carboxypeptidase